MDLNKQNKDDLIKHIESQNRIITTKDDRIKSANDRCRLAELKLQRALGYIDKIGNFSITVTSQESDLNIAYIKTEPILPRVGEEVTLTIRLENFGKGDANSVKAKIEIPFFGVKESFLERLLILKPKTTAVQ